MATGKIVAVSDHGSVVTLYVRHKSNTTVAVGDGNLTRRALHAVFSGEHPVGQYIEYELETWGGLKWFRPSDADADQAEDASGAGRR